MLPNAYRASTQLSSLMGADHCAFGPDTAGVRQQPLAYVKQAAARMAQSDPVLGSRTTERLLDNVADEGTIPTPIIVLLAWLVLIFASFGYCRAAAGMNMEMKFCRNWLGHEHVMQIRSFRRSGEPGWINVLSSAGERLGPDPRRALGPAATPAASTGRTRDPKRRFGGGGAIR